MVWWINGRERMHDVKMDALEESFEAIARQDEDVAELREELGRMKARMDAEAVAGARPAAMPCRRRSTRRSSGP